MEKVCVFLADGFEEGEALIPVDLLRRAGAEVTTASISTSLCVQGSHGITVTADALAENVPLEEYGMVVLPGGLRGTQNLSQSALVKRAVLAFARQGKWVAAICARARAFGRVGAAAGAAGHLLPLCRGKMRRRCADARRSVHRRQPCHRRGWARPSLWAGPGWHIAGRPKAPASKKPVYIHCVLPFPNAKARHLAVPRFLFFTFPLFFPRAWPRSALPYEDGLPTRR